MIHVAHIPAFGPAAVLIPVHLALGFGLGLIYFSLVWGSARLFAGGGRTGISILLVLARIGALAAVMVFAALEGAGPLLATALGLLVARPIVMRRHREATT